MLSVLFAVLLFNACDEHATRVVCDLRQLMVLAARNATSVGRGTGIVSFVCVWCGEERRGSWI